MNDSKTSDACKFCKVGRGDETRRANIGVVAWVADGVFMACHGDLLFTKTVRSKELGDEEKHWHPYECDDNEGCEHLVFGDG